MEEEKNKTKEQLLAESNARIAKSKEKLRDIANRMNEKNVSAKNEVEERNTQRNAESNKSNEYPQKIYDTLAKPEFREYLGLIYKDAGGDLELFSLDVLENIGSKAKEYIDILYLVGSKVEK